MQKEITKAGEGYNFAKSYMMTLDLIEPRVNIEYETHWSHQPMQSQDKRVITVYATRDGRSDKIYWKHSRPLDNSEIGRFMDGIKKYRSEQ